MPYIMCANEHEEALSADQDLIKSFQWVQCENKAVGMIVTDDWSDDERDKQQLLPHCETCAPEMMHELKQMGHEYIITIQFNTTTYKEHQP